VKIIYDQLHSQHKVCNRHCLSLQLLASSVST
jgi:hypothetical protein